MAEQAQADEKISLSAKVVFILLAGALSMFFAEVCSGSSVLWFISSWAWLVTFWLYLAHTILFINLALYFRRTSLSALYLWGVLFGLYEAWITKVIWAGYMGQAPSMGTFLGFAVQEFPLIVFFWHPVMSFILPVLAFEALSGRVLPGHRSVLLKSKRTWMLAIAVVILGATFLAFNSGSNIVATAVTAPGSFALIGALYLIARKRYKDHFSLESLRLGKPGMIILLVYLALLYLVTFIYIFPERIAPPFTILLTLGVYAFIAILLYLKKPDTGEPSSIPEGNNIFGIKELIILAAAFTILAALLCLIPAISYPLTLGIYIVLFLMAPVPLAVVIVKIIRGRLKRAGA